MTPSTTPTVKLGLMPPLTGLVGIYGTEIVHAGQIACQEVNETGGVLGRPLELVIEDDGSLPESAVSAAEQLVAHYDCAAIIGNLLSNSRIAVAYRVAEPRKIPYLNFSFYEGSILSRYFFHFAALPNQQIDRMIPHMRAKFGPRMFFAGSSYEWPRGSIDAATRALLRAGGEVVGEEYCPIGVDPSTLETLLDRVSEAAPDVFVPYFAGADQVSLLTRFTERGLKSRMAVVMGHYDELMASKLPPEVREGFYSSNTYFMTVDGRENRDYLARLAAMPGVSGIWPDGNGILTNFGEGTYLCVKAFARAANAAGTIEPEALVDALGTISIVGPQGAVRMDPATQHATVNTYLSRCNAAGVFEIVERFGAIPPQIPERYSHQRIGRGNAIEEDVRLQARMLEQMSEAVMLVDTQNGEIVYANGGAYRMFGYGRGELIGLPIVKLNAPKTADPERLAAEIIGILHRTGSWQGIIQNIRKDGSTLWCSATVTTFTHPVYGEVWLGVHQDITERKRAEEELARHREHLEELVHSRTADLEAAKNEAERANRAKSEFLSRMSHELRTPMNAILGFSQLLGFEPLNAEQIDHVREIYHAGEHLLALINELLDLSRIESGRITTSLQPVNLQSIVTGAYQIVQPLISERRLTFRSKCDARATLRADPTRLKQVLVNLLSNAAKYNRADGAIDVACEAVDEATLRITVTDTGAGIAPDKLNLIFKPFERLGAEHGPIEGTGIGLALCKQLVELMDGRMGVTSSIGRGSTFWIELPWAPPAAALGASPAPAPARSKSGHTMLYVEDNAANLRLVDAIVRKLSDAHLLSAIDGESGVELAKRHLPDVILLDIHLPKMDGYAVLEALRADSATRRIPVIALSADAMPADVERARRAGFSDYITKPIEVPELIRVLERALTPDL